MVSSRGAPPLARRASLTPISLSSYQCMYSLGASLVIEGTTVCSHQTASRWMAAIWFWKARSPSKSGGNERVQLFLGPNLGWNDPQIRRHLPPRALHSPGPAIGEDSGLPLVSMPSQTTKQSLTFLLAFVPGHAGFFHLGGDAEHHGDGQQVCDVDDKPVLKEPGESAETPVEPRKENSRGRYCGT